MQNLIKRHSGPSRRSALEGKTLAEKLAMNEAAHEAAYRAAQAPAVEPVEATRAEAAQPLPPRPAPAASADPSDTAAIVAAAKAMRDRYAGEAAPAAVARTCLIVDDSRVIRKVSSKIAISLDYVAIEAENGEEALARGDYKGAKMGLRRVRYYHAGILLCC